MTRICLNFFGGYRVSKSGWQSHQKYFQFLRSNYFLSWVIRGTFSSFLPCFSAPLPSGWAVQWCQPLCTTVRSETGKTLKSLKTLLDTNYIQTIKPVREDMILRFLWNEAGLHWSEVKFFTSALITLWDYAFVYSIANSYNLTF